MLGRAVALPGGLLARIMARFRCQYRSNEEGVDSEVGVGVAPPPPAPPPPLVTIAPLNRTDPGAGY